MRVRVARGSITLPGSMFLASIALIPSIALAYWAYNQFPFGGTRGTGNGHAHDVSLRIHGHDRVVVRRHPSRPVIVCRSHQLLEHDLG